MDPLRPQSRLGAQAPAPSYYCSRSRQGSAQASRAGPTTTKRKKRKAKAKSKRHYYYYLLLLLLMLLLMLMPTLMLLILLQLLLGADVVFFVAHLAAHGSRVLYRCGRFRKIYRRRDPSLEQQPFTEDVFASSWTSACASQPATTASASTCSFSSTSSGPSQSHIPPNTAEAPSRSDDS